MSLWKFGAQMVAQETAGCFSGEKKEKDVGDKDVDDEEKVEWRKEQQN